MTRPIHPNPSAAIELSSARSEGVSSLERWIDQHQGEAYTVALRFNAVNADDPREFINGKVLVSDGAARYAVDALENYANQMLSHDFHDACKARAEEFRQALQPNTGDGE